MANKTLTVQSLAAMVDQTQVMVMLGKKLPNCYHECLANTVDNDTNSKYVIIYKPGKAPQAKDLARCLWEDFEQKSIPIYNKIHRIYVWIPQELC